MHSPTLIIQLASFVFCKIAFGLGRFARTDRVNMANYIFDICAWVSPLVWRRYCRVMFTLSEVWGSIDAYITVYRYAVVA